MLIRPIKCFANSSTSLHISSPSRSQFGIKSQCVRFTLKRKSVESLIHSDSMQQKLKQNKNANSVDTRSVFEPCAREHRKNINGLSTVLACEVQAPNATATARDSCARKRGGRRIQTELKII